MNSTAKPIRSTIVWGLFSGFAFIPLCAGISHVLFWPLGFQVSIWILLAGYGVLLARWAQKPLGSIFIPLLLQFLAAFLIRSTDVFLFLALVNLSWIRSGFCFNQRSFGKRLGVEMVFGPGAALFVLGWVPAVSIPWALGVWLFFLTQALYFVLFEYRYDAEAGIKADPFEKAQMAAQKILANGVF